MFEIQVGNRRGKTCASFVFLSNSSMFLVTLVKDRPKRKERELSIAWEKWNRADTLYRLSVTPVELVYCTYQVPSVLSQAVT